jgi:hypothetical protein
MTPRKPGKQRRAKPLKGKNRKLNSAVRAGFWYQIRPLALFGVAAGALFFLFCGKHQFKAHVSGTPATLREFLLRLEAGPVRGAMLGVQNLIDP